MSVEMHALVDDLVSLGIGEGEEAALLVHLKPTVLVEEGERCGRVVSQLLRQAGCVDSAAIDSGRRSYTHTRIHTQTNIHTVTSHYFIIKIFRY